MENTALANEKNVKLITAGLIGCESPDIIAYFKFNGGETKVVRCLSGHEPKNCSYMVSSNQCQVSFLRELCAGCPYQNQCHPKINKRGVKAVTS